MWHEARKQEKKLRETMVNYQKRAERRKEHYDKLRGDPHQLLRVYGNKCKLHLDPKTASTLDSTMIPWQGDRAHIISPYDVRIHLDYIPDYSKLPEHIPSKEEKHEESRCNYERYRVLVQNTFHGLSEADALAKIAVEEMYPEPSKKSSKKSKSGGSAIGYSYDDNGDSSGKSSRQYKKPKEIEEAEDEEKGFSGESEYEVDMDVDSFNTFEVDKLNVIALDYKMPAGAFSKSLRAEKSDLLEQKMVRLAELEKTAISGKLSRRERKTWKESQQQAGGPLDNRPAYTVRGSPTYDPYEDEGSRSRSRSTSPEFEGKVEYITEFGGNDEDTQPPATTSAATATDAGNGRSAAAASAELAPKSHSSSKSGKKMSSRHEESSTRSRSRDSSRRRDRRRRDSSDRDNYRSDRDRRRHRDYYSSSRRRSPEQYSRSSRYRNYSRSRSRDRYSRRYRDESYSRSRSRSRDRGRYRDRGRERERDRHSDRRRKYYSSSSSDSSRHYSRDKYKSHSHSNRKRSRSSSGYSGRSRSRSVSVSRNETVEKPRSRSKSRSVTPQLPVPVQPQADPVEDLPSRIIQPSPPPAHSPVMMDLDQHNDRQEKNDEPIETRPVKQETKTPGKGKLSRRERLMKKMQAQLNKQHKMDKKAVKIKEKKKKAERMEREDQLREHQRKLKETHREELKEASYTYSGQAETYKMAAAAESDEESDGPSSPDSPTRLLMLGGRHSKNDKGTTKDNDFYYGRFS